MRAWILLGKSYHFWFWYSYYLIQLVYFEKWKCQKIRHAALRLPKVHDGFGTACLASAEHGWQERLPNLVYLEQLLQRILPQNLQWCRRLNTSNFFPHSWHPVWRWSFCQDRFVTGADAFVSWEKWEAALPSLLFLPGSAEGLVPTGAASPTTLATAASWLPSVGPRIYVW